MTAAELEQQAKDKMKQRYYRKTVVRSFSVGDEVMVRISDWEGSLDHWWIGPGMRLLER